MEKNLCGRRLFSIGLLIVAIALFAIPCGSFAAEKVITLRFAHFMPSVAAQVKLANEWAQEVEKRTAGRVKVTVYPGSTLMPVAQTYDSITKGTADIGYGIFTYHRGRFPLTEVIDLPLGYKSGYYATELINEYYKKFKPKELEDVKVLWLEAHGPGFLHTKKPVSKLEDLKGMKIRTGGLQSKIASVLGAAPVSIPITDAYDALSKGVADGICLNDEGILIWSLGDVVKCHLRNWGTTYTAGFYTVMNKEKWNSLPKDIQAIIEKIDEEWIEKAAVMWQERDEVMRDTLAKKGNQFVELTKEEDARWAALVEPVLADYVKMTKEKGLPGEEALQFCQDYLQKNDKVDHRNK